MPETIETGEGAPSGAPSGCRKSGSATFSRISRRTCAGGAASALCKESLARQGFARAPHLSPRAIARQGLRPLTIPGFFDRRNFRASGGRALRKPDRTRKRCNEEADNKPGGGWKQKRKQRPFYASGFFFYGNKRCGTGPMQQGKEHRAYRRKPRPAIVDEERAHFVQRRQFRKAACGHVPHNCDREHNFVCGNPEDKGHQDYAVKPQTCLLYTSDAADD